MQAGLTPLQTVPVEVKVVLVEGGADPAKTDDKGETMLHQCESTELAAALLKHGADPNAVNDGKPTSFDGYESLSGSIVIESQHPYENNSCLFWDVSIPGAEGIEVCFDPRSSISGYDDCVRFYKDATHTDYWGEDKYRGAPRWGNGKKNFPTVDAPLLIPASSVVVHLFSGHLHNEWGFKLVAWAKGRKGVPLTPLQTTRSAEVRLLLVQAGAEPNVVDNAGRSPLHMCESPALAAALLKAGADASRADQVGEPNLMGGRGVCRVAAGGALSFP